MEFYIYLAIVLSISMTLLRVGCANQGFSKPPTLVVILFPALCWTGLIWYWKLPSNIYFGVFGAMLSLEAALLVSKRALSRCKALGYIN